MQKRALQNQASLRERGVCTPSLSHQWGVIRADRTGFLLVLPDSLCSVPSLSTPHHAPYKHTHAYITPTHIHTGSEMLILPSEKQQPDTYPPPVYDNIYMWKDRSGGENRMKKDNTENFDTFEKIKEIKVGWERIQ